MFNISFILILLIIALCFDFSSACRSYPVGNETNKYFPFPGNGSKNGSHFGSYWNAWKPPPGDDTWMLWISIWGNPNTSKFDSTEEGRGPETGWPQYFKGMGKGIDGVPPPPWAYVPGGYGKPDFCFLLPVKGNCNGYMLRWGYNPTNNTCEQFIYSGCDANQNNFRDEATCNDACVAIPSSDCKSNIDFQKLIYD